ncbi:MAG: efflux RND transporter permease subunit [Phycisphaerales bacterium]|nr:efflux RND transporter permease subunit [Phycisphaerales bacterium]
MHLSSIFIRRPIATTLLMATLLIFGIMAYTKLPVSDLPDVGRPTIVVSAALPGANPYTMASSVATPLEKQFTQIAGLQAMTSQSSLGTTSITLTFALSRNINNCALDVQAAISRAGGQLPHNMPNPPTYQKVNPADQAILLLVLQSKTLPMYTVDDYAENLLGDAISEVNGVAAVNVFGAQTYAVRIQVNPKALAARGIGIDQLMQTIQNANVNQPTGVLWGDQRAYQIYSQGQLTTASSYRPMIVQRNAATGAVVRLQQVARVLNGVVNDKQEAWYFADGKFSPAVILAIQKQPDANTIAIVDDIEKLLPKLQASLPPSLQLRTMYDKSVDIRQGVYDVKLTLGLALMLVTLVIFAFLKNIRATVIPVVAMPLAIIGTFGIMYEMHYTIDYFSLLAVTLAVGFIVDDAVVMLENCHRHIEMGEAPMQAAYHASREISFTILSMTLSLVAVFIPIIFLQGIIGRLLNEFAITLATAILFSGLISLTLTPMLCSRLLKGTHNQKHNVLYRVMDGLFDWSHQIYLWLLRLALKARIVMLLLSVAALYLTIHLLIIIPKGFIPAGDSGHILVATQAAEGVSYQNLVRSQLALGKMVGNDPNVANFMSIAGGGPFGLSNGGEMFFHLKPVGERPLTTDQLMGKLRKEFARVVGIKTFLQNIPPINVNGQLTKAQYQFTLLSPDTTALFKYAPILTDRLRKLSGLEDVNNNLLINAPQINVIPDDNRAELLGVSHAAIEDALGLAYGQEQISTIYDPQAQYEVIMEVQPAYQRNLRDLSLLYVTSDTGKLIPLNAVTRVTKSRGPLIINQTGILPSVTISFNLASNYSLSSAVSEIQTTAKAVLPPQIITNFQGAAQMFNDAIINMGELLIIAVVVIYIVLGILYESFIHPVTILTALPFAGLGALVALIACHDSLDLYAFVGVIMLIGLVKKNGIMMVDFAITERTKGTSPVEAIYKACSVRFRPIMMTTMAALLGTLPIALGTGADADTRRPLGIAVVGGLLFSQFLTLLVTPVFYVYFEEFQTWLSRRKNRGAAGS